MSADKLPGWRETTAKQWRSVEFVAAVTDPAFAGFVPERDRVAVFDNDGTLWTEQPVYAQLMFALDRAAELGHPTSLEELHEGGKAALLKLVALTHAGITTEEFDAAVRAWLASARHPRFGRALPGNGVPADAGAARPAGPQRLLLLDLLRRRHRLHADLDRRCLRAAAAPRDRQRRRHRVPRPAHGGPQLLKTAKVAVIDDGPQKPSSIHRHIGQRPILAAGNTDGDLPMLQWTAASPYRTLELVIHHTDADREYAYDRDPILGSGTDQILAAAAEHKWTVIDMAADWATVHPDN